MQNNSLENEKIIENLSSDNPEIRRETIELFFETEADDEIAKAISEKLLDKDNGVRDAVCSTLINNPNQNIPFFVVPYTGSALDIGTRNLAGEILLKRGVASIPAMVDYIDKGDDDDKKFIIDLLGLIGDKSPEDKIIEVLETNKDDNVLLACQEALGNIKSEKAIPILEKFYNSNELFKPTIIEALGKIGSENAVQFILEKYSSEDELTKFSMIESLGRIGNEEAFFMLLGELSNLTGALTWAAIDTLHKLKNKFEFDVPFDEHMKNAILSTLLEGELHHKRAAANLISAFDDREIVEACLKIFGEDDEIDYNIKTRIFENAGFAYPKIAEYLKAKPNNVNKLLELVKEIIQNDGGESLGELNDYDFRNLIDAFTVSLDHPDEVVRMDSAELLFFISPETAILFLDTMMEDDNYWNRLRVLEILESFENEEATEAIKKFLNDPEEMVKEKAEEILNQRN